MAYDRCFDDIITRAFANKETGEIDIPFDSASFKKDLNDAANRLFNIYREMMPEQDLLHLSKLAHKDALDNIMADMKARTYQLERQALVQKSLLNKVKNTDSPEAALLSEIKQAGAEGDAIYRAAIAGPLHDFSVQFKSNIPSGIDIYFKRNNNVMEDVVRAMGGEEIELPVAKGYAKAIVETRNKLLNEMESLGYRVNRLEGYDIPHRWSRKAVRRLGETDFVAKVGRALDLHKTVKADGSPYNKQELKELLSQIYNEIISGRHEEFKVTSKLTSRAARHNRRRSLHFKSSSEWLKIHKEFGEGNLFEIVDDQIQNLSKDIAILKRFGPNAEESFKAAHSAVKADKLSRKGKLSGKEKIARGIGVEKAWRELTGEAYSLSNPNSSYSRAVADISSAVNSSTATAVHLGFSFFTTFLDQANVRAAARVLGLNYRKILGDTMMEFAGIAKSSNGRRLSKLMSAGVDDILAGRNLNGRFEDMTAYGTFSKMIAGAADFTVRASLLHRLTRIQKEVFGRHLNAEISGHIAKSFDKLPESIKFLFKEADASEETWKIMQESVRTENGIKFIDPEIMFNKSPKAAGEFFGIIQENTRYAVAEPGIEAKAILHQGQQPDTALGVGMRALAGLKSFTVSNTINHIRRMFLDPRVTNKASYFANYAIYATMLGALSTQLALMARGKDPYALDNPLLWASAISKASIFGFGGDLVLSATQQGKPITGLAQFAVPGLAAYLDLFSHIGKAGFNAIDEPEQSAGRVLQGFSRLPPSNLWYASLLSKRLFWDQLQKAVDPKAKKEARKRKRRAKKQGRPTEWWEFGDTSPGREPRPAGPKK